MQLRPQLRRNWPCWLAIAVGAAALKFYYSRADIEGLRWVLEPTTRLVSLSTGVQFIYNVDAGYIAEKDDVIVTAACAGVNIMLVSFCMLAFNYACRPRTVRGRLAMLLGSGLAAYAFTIVVNACRIAMALRFTAPAFTAAWSPETVHRLEGIAVYFTALLVLYATAEFVFHRWNRWNMGTAEDSSSRRLAFRVPLYWYLFFAVGIPLLRLPNHDNASGFRQHAGTVLAVAGGMVLVLRLFRWCLGAGSAVQLVRWGAGNSVLR